MDANGANPTQLTTDLNTHGQLPDWIPDGSKIAYQDVIGGFGRILVMNADGSNPTQLTFGPGDDFGAAWSPDGRQIAFVRNFGNGNRPIYLMNADGTDQLRSSAAAVSSPGWQTRGVGADDYGAG
jgi:Tol biopolymer transport system component